LAGYFRDGEAIRHPHVDRNAQAIVVPDADRRLVEAEPADQVIDRPRRRESGDAVAAEHG
jgi:hypothetical protein